MNLRFDEHLFAAQSFLLIQKYVNICARGELNPSKKDIRFIEFNILDILIELIFDMQIPLQSTFFT